jgi:hypothetical protein
VGAWHAFSVRCVTILVRVTKRLQTLMASKNKIRSIAPLDQALPNLTSLVLIDNDLATPQVSVFDCSRSKKHPSCLSSQSTY